MPVLHRPALHRPVSHWPVSHWPAAALCALVLLSVAVLAGCDGQSATAGHDLVPWTDEPADTAQLAESTTPPPCRLAVLQMPHDQQQWGGVWHGGVSGYFVLRNGGRTACELPKPSRVTAVTTAGERAVFNAGRLPAASAVLDPGEEVQVQLSSPYDCGKPLVRSAVFALRFPKGTLRVPHARMAVQCGGALVDFSARETGGSSGRTTGATPASRLRVTMSRVPRSVPAGDQVAYAVTLTNPTSRAISLDQCPSYQEGIKGEPSSVRAYQLNCGAVRKINAHSSVSFAMQLPLPSRVARGEAVLDWKLQVPSDTVDQRRFASATTAIR